jgi:antitoxin (DNA-binding transcriptional repressor) of toxin-antitoxin stability system
MTKVALKNAKAHLAELVEAAISGEEIVIAREDGAMVEMKRRAPERRKAGSGKGWFVMAEDFDAPLNDFNEYMP